MYPFDVEHSRVLNSLTVGCKKIKFDKKKEKCGYTAPVKDEAYPATTWHFAGNGGAFSLVAISTA